METEYLHISEIARELGVSPPAARRLIEIGRMRAEDMNGKKLVTRQEFENYRSTYRPFIVGKGRGRRIVERVEF